MRIDRLSLKDFTVFAQADMDFSPGLNVLIGANGTGKSHVLKVMYSILRPMASLHAEIVVEPQVVNREAENRRWDKLFAVLRPTPATRPDSGQSPFQTLVRSLTRHGGDDLSVDVRSDFGEVKFKVGPSEVPWWRIEAMPSGLAVFVPSPEVLSIYPGFVALYERRELSFDETFRDLCVDLSASPLRSISSPLLAKLAATLENAVGGKTELRGERFYVSLSEDWLLEASMLAEGLRKLASIAQLIRNGSLAENGVVFLG